MLNEMQRVSESASRNQLTFSPNFDVREDKDAYVLEGELPGMKREDVSIEFRDDQTVTVKGHREYRREEGRRPGTVEEGGEKGEGGKTIENGATATNTNNASESKEVTQTNAGGKEVELAQSMPKHTYWVSERSEGEFSRSFSFPNRVDQDRVTASLKDGVLSVVLPKVAKKERARKIEIE